MIIATGWAALAARAMAAGGVAGVVGWPGARALWLALRW
jgi:hypothetical protein